MTLTEKFRADVQRTIKHERADNNGRYDASKAIEKIMNLFMRSTVVPGNLPRAVAYYWKETFIDPIPSEEMENEPTPYHIDMLAAFLGFLENTHEDEDLIEDEDWKELGELVNFEAEDLPIETLQALMMTIVSKGAI